MLAFGGCAGFAFGLGLVVLVGLFARLVDCGFGLCCLGLRLFLGICYFVGWVWVYDCVYSGWVWRVLCMLVIICGLITCLLL